jgi:uncharacterized protein YndB with AHSA1/START domain
MVFEMLTQASGLREWFCVYAYTEPRKSGRWQIRWRSGVLAYGTYTRFIPSQKVAFTWNVVGEPGENQVQIALKEVDGATRVVLSHWDIRRAANMKSIELEWSASLDNLKSVLETGIDQRNAHLPRIGLGFESAEGNQGVRVTFVMPEGPAAQVGLEKEDIMTSFCGHRLYTAEDFMNVYMTCRAGQHVRVVYLRGQKRHTANVELGARLLPQIPADTATLIEQVDLAHRQALSGLRDCLQNLSDEAAAQAPVEGEWSVLQVLGHLCASERAFQSWVADTVLGRETGWIEARLTEQLAVVSATAPTFSLLLEHLERDLLESRSMVAAMTREHLAYKMRYRRIARMLLDFAGHIQIHTQQIQWTVQALREK